MVENYQHMNGINCVLFALLEERHRRLMQELSIAPAQVDHVLVSRVIGIIEAEPRSEGICNCDHFGHLVSAGARSYECKYNRGYSQDVTILASTAPFVFSGMMSHKCRNARERIADKCQVSRKWFVTFQK